MNVLPCLARKGILAACFIAGTMVASAEEPREHPSSYTARLMTTLSGLDLDSPESDARRNIAHGDLRLVGITQYSCDAPERQSNRLANIARVYGLRCLSGTTDMSEGEVFEDLMQVAIGYARRYNEVVHNFLTDPGSVCPTDLQPIEAPAPKLPARFHNEFEGQATVAFLVGTQGNILSPVVIAAQWRPVGKASGNPQGYEIAIVQAVARWRYPARNGVCRHESTISISHN